jgi:hypothetical protein
LIFDFRFSIFDFRFSIFDFRFLIFDFRFSIFDFRFSIFDFRFSIFDFRFSISIFDFGFRRAAWGFLRQGRCLVEPGVAATQEPLPRVGPAGFFNPEAGCLGDAKGVKGNRFSVPPEATALPW